VFGSGKGNGGGGGGDAMAVDDAGAGSSSAAAPSSSSSSSAASAATDGLPANFRGLYGAWPLLRERPPARPRGGDVVGDHAGRGVRRLTFRLRALPITHARPPLLPAELFAVVTHKGRSADSGHYMAWVRREGARWLVFDDDAVSETDTEYVTTTLKGGGDDHMAYLLFYRAKA
jgi:hypothetical protein